MAASGHLVNYFFYDLAYSIDQHMFSGVFRGKEFISGIFLMIPPYFDPEIQDGCHLGNRCLNGVVCAWLFGM